MAFALQADGWYLRSEIIWHKRAPMPESVTDRPTKAHEQVFLLAKSATYFYDAEAIKEPANPAIQRSYAVNATEATGNTGGNKRTDFEKNRHTVSERNKRSVWTLGPEQFSGWTPTSRLARVEADDVSDDTRCKVSPDCPVHAGLFDWAATDSYDVRVGDLLSRMSRKRTRRAPKPAFGSAPTDQHRGAAKSGQSSDLPHLPYSLFAIDHSNGSHKTGPDPVTNQPYNVSDETPDRIDDRQDAPDYGTPSQNKSLNNTAVGDSASNEVSEILDRNVHSYELPDSLGASIIPPECTCEFYHEITENTSHFATMPTKLVEPCILAGSSAHGCCSKCKAPWERVVESEQVAKHKQSGKPWLNSTEGVVLGRKESPNCGLSRETATAKTTTGWQPTCTCNADVIPCTALDPFSGSGTTLAVALKHGRSAIGIDLNADYITLAHDRIGRTQPLLLDIT